MCSKNKKAPSKLMLSAFAAADRIFRAPEAGLEPATL
jgi:hypothetical protein